jgi:hypothetical protein
MYCIIDKDGYVHYVPTEILKKMHPKEISEVPKVTGLRSKVKKGYYYVK